jgi:hypothetical protein
MTCESCGKPFPVRPHRLKKYNVRCCSRSCLWKVTLAEREPLRLASICGRHPSNYIESNLSCKQCGNGFHAPPSVAKTRLYCSMECQSVFLKAIADAKARKVASDKVARASPKEPEIIMDACRVCNKEFRRHRRRAGQLQVYCSKSCRYKDMVETRVCKTCGETYTRNKLSTKSTEYCSKACIQRCPCLFCGKVVIGRASFQSHSPTGKAQYCTKRCAALANRTVNGSLNYVVKGFAMTIHRLGKLACERCGFDEPDGLTVHHRDRDRSNCAGSNLETLCGTCHAIEHWKGSQKRRKDIAVAELLAKHAIDRIG